MKKGALRNAEKNRTATCPFANTIATVAIQQYRHVVQDLGGIQFQQTALAAFVLQIFEEEKETEFLVASLGIGTKFLTKEKILEDVEGECVRDMHAEVTARRGFVSFLYEQLEKCTEKEGSIVFDRDLSGNKFHLKTNVHIHFYTSSQPCGNACLKKFAKNRKEGDQYGTTSASICPDIAHAPKSFSAVREGEISLLLKGSPPASEGHAGRNRILSPTGTHFVSQANFEASNSCVHTCSDKIARWNLLGLQGSLLRHFIPGTIHMRSCTIGRKFGRPFSERALCCRLQNIEMPTVNHPVLLCTSVKLDESVYEGANAGAVFAETRCIAWAYGSSGASMIDGATGKQLDGSSSFISKRAFAQRFEHIVKLLWRNGRTAGGDPDQSVPYDELKQLLETSYMDAKARLLSERGFNFRKASFRSSIGTWVRSPRCRSLMLKLPSSFVDDRRNTKTVSQLAAESRRKKRKLGE